MIKTATIEDAIEIASIYNYYIEETIITFEKNAITENGIISRMSSNDLPWLVFKNEGTIIGYAYASEWKSRCAYEGTLEVTVYVRNGNFNKGIGKALYTELISKLKELKYHTLIGGIALPNDSSIALHEKMGFKKTAHFKEVGYKLDKWVDVAYWQLMIN